MSDADGVMLNKLKCFSVVTSTTRPTTASNVSESLAVEQSMPQARWNWRYDSHWKHEHTGEMRFSGEPCEGRCAKKLAWTAGEAQLRHNCRRVRDSGDSSATVNMEWDRYEPAVRSNLLLQSSTEITSSSSSSSSSSCSWRIRHVSCSLIVKMKLVPPSLPRSSYVPLSFWFIL